MKKETSLDDFFLIVQYLTMLCGTLWEVLKNRLFQYLKSPVNFNVKFHIKKSVSSRFPYMSYTIGEVTSKAGQTSKMKLFQKRINSFRSLDVWMGSKCTFGWRTEGVLCNLTKSYDSTKPPQKIREVCFSWN